jgi:hypothetical protein
MIVKYYNKDAWHTIDNVTEVIDQYSAFAQIEATTGEEEAEEACKTMTGGKLLPLTRNALISPIKSAHLIICNVKGEQIAVATNQKVYVLNDNGKTVDTYN